MRDIPFLPAADAEFLHAVAHYEEELPGLGADLIGEVEAALQRITAFPEHGGLYFAGTRRVVLRRYPFSLVYSNEAEGLLVIALAHHRQRHGYWLERILRPRV